MNSLCRTYDHLGRAKELLKDSKSESLFYCALELRYAVESRLLEYSEYAEQYSKNKFGKWRLSDLSKHVESIFDSKGLVYSIEVTSASIPQPIIISYTPVTRELCRIVGKTNNFLHYSGVLQCLNIDEQNKLRSLLNEGIEEAEKSNLGGLCGPLIKDKNGIVSLIIETKKHPEFQEALKKGDEISIRIDYNLLTKSNQPVEPSGVPPLVHG